MSSLSGKIALVTGASRGIGLAISSALREAGAHVAGLSREIKPTGVARQTSIRCDVSKPGEVSDVIARLVVDPGLPDIVVNNAGTFLLKPLVDTTVAEFDEQIQVNLRAPFLVIRELLPHLIRKGSAHIVTIGSIADHTAFPGNAAYGASKFGLRGLHEVVRKEMVGTDVRTTLVSPGPTNTELWDSVGADQDVLDRTEMLVAEDVAEAVLFALTRPSHVDVESIRIGPARMG
jgi:NADP-dependent 3-hydroxy acid dehydrogenase YdfG